MQKTFKAWGGLQALQDLSQPFTSLDAIDFSKASYLGYGLGRSYGDSCLNSNGTGIFSSLLKRFIAFDEAQGLLTVEAGTTLRQVAEWGLKRGWFLPVSPGTQDVTVGGAIANDVHGKNHHIDGSFGHHVLSFELLRSDGSRSLCSAKTNADLFKATIGGLGLSGFITKATVRLKKVAGPWIDQEQIRFTSLKEYFELSQQSADWTYVVSWIDCFSAHTHGKLKGIFIRGRHAAALGNVSSKKAILGIPFYAPSWILNSLSMRLFNFLYYAKNLRKHQKSRVHYEPFFYPLDAVGNWNRMYGVSGLLQYQCVVPFENAEQSVARLLALIAQSKLGSFLAVLKNFGSHAAPGLLSFARPGVTLALDFKNSGTDVQQLFAKLDAIVLQAGGALYPAKDQRMSAQMFQKSFARLAEFKKFIDPKFSSDFWKRTNTP